MHDHNNLARFAALIETERMARAISAAQDAVRAVLHQCPSTAISLSGGKDSVAAAIIARSVDPSMTIVCAHPPNPLPYRDGHIADLRAWFGGPWLDIDYGWDVAAVLDGRRSYPARLKIESLLAIRQPGFILGVRASESRARMINHRMRGQVYKTAAGWRCLPLARWTAEEVIGLAVYFGAPIAEVYRKPLLGLTLDQVRDGTWWAHTVNPDAEDWIRRNYPQHHADWLRSTELQMAQRREIF